MHTIIIPHKTFLIQEQNPMRTKQQYADDLKKMKKNLYLNGEKIGRDHKDLEFSINVMGKTFEGASDPETEDLCTATSHLTNEPINRFCHISYLHVVEKNSDGIIVRGCKVHITFAAVADEIIVVPTRALTPDEGDWAVAFAMPADAEGIKQVINIHNMRSRNNFQRGFDFGCVDSYVIFDDVFVPWERVFLCGEHQHGGLCAMLFALFHRHSYSGCKPAVGDIIMGMAGLAAEVNGITKTSHVRDKLAQLMPQVLQPHQKARPNCIFQISAKFPLVPEGIFQIPSMPM